MGRPTPEVAVKDEHKCSSCKGEDVMSVSYCISCNIKLCARHEQVIYRYEQGCDWLAKNYATHF